MQYFKTNQDRDIYLYINEIYKKIIKYFVTYNWEFTEEIINRLNTIPNIKDKQAIYTTTTLMLKKTMFQKSGTVGLSKDQIHIIINFLFMDCFTEEKSQSQAALKWLEKLVDSPNIKIVIKEKIDKIDEIQDLKKILPITPKLLEEQNVQTISAKILESSLNYNKLKENNKLVSTIANGKMIIQKTLLDLLENCSLKKIDDYKSAITTCLDNQKVFTSNNIEQIIDNNFIPLLSHEFSNAIFACEQLLRFNEIPPSKKSLLRTVYGRIRVPKKDKEKEEHKQILKKLGQILKK